MESCNNEPCSVPDMGWSMALENGDHGRIIILNHSFRKVGTLCKNSNDLRIRTFHADDLCREMGFKGMKVRSDYENKALQQISKLESRVHKLPFLVNGYATDPEHEQYKLRRSTPTRAFRDIKLGEMGCMMGRARLGSAELLFRLSPTFCFE
jgi:tRNA-dihydrouridine synthase